MLIIPDIMPYAYCTIIAVAASLAVTSEDARWITLLPSAFSAMLAVMLGLPFYISAMMFFALFAAMLIYYYAISVILGRK